MTEASGRVTGVSDLRGKAPLASSGGTGPVLGTDLLGRRYLRFTGSTQDFLRNVADLTGQDPHNMTVFAVVRWNTVGSVGKSAILSVGNNGATPASHLFAQLGVHGGSNGTRPQAPFLAGLDSIVAVQSPAGRNKLIMSAGLQVIGISTATADGVGGTTTSVAVRHYHMDQMLSLTRSIARQTGKVGIEVGRRASGTAGGSSSDYFNGDIYELAGWCEGQFTLASYAAASDAIRDAMMTNWGLSAFTASVILGEDSRTAQDPNLNFASILTDPGGAQALPVTTRVVNMGAGGTGTILASQLTQNDLGPYATGSMLGGGKDVAVDFGGFNDIFTTSSGWPAYTTAQPTDATPNTGRAEEIYNGTALDCSFTAWIYASGGIEVVSVSAGYIVVGQAINMPGVPAGSFISSFVGGSGTNGGPARYAVSSPTLLTVTSLGAAISATTTMPTQLRNIQTWLSRGFKVVKAVESANAAPAQPAHETLRGKIRSNLTPDALAGSGQTYDGKLRIMDLTEIAVGGSKIFGANAAAPSGPYYYDVVHFTPAGRIAVVGGGDTPANGFRANIVASLA